MDAEHTQHYTGCARLYDQPILMKIPGVLKEHEQTTGS